VTTAKRRYADGIQAYGMCSTCRY